MKKLKVFESETSSVRDEYYGFKNWSKWKDMNSKEIIDKYLQPLYGKEFTADYGNKRSEKLAKVTLDHAQINHPSRNDWFIEVYVNISDSEKAKLKDMGVDYPSTTLLPNYIIEFDEMFK